MTELAIRVHGTPAPQGSKRHLGRGVLVESSKAVKPWREAVKYAALEVLLRARQQPLSGPVILDVTFLLPRPKGHYRTGRFDHLLRDSAPLYPAGKPDIDKLVRSTLDGLGEAGVFRDDAQVVSLDGTVKLYADDQHPPGAVIRIRPTRRARVGDVGQAKAGVAG